MSASGRSPSRQVRPIGRGASLTANAWRGGARTACISLLEGISPGYGYLAIIVALLGGNAPLGVLIAAVGVSALQVGSLSMQRSANVPASIASIIMGTVVLLILARKTLFKGLLAGKGE